MVPFQLKGSAFTLPVLKIQTLDWPIFNDYLEKTLLMSPSFFTQAPLVIDVTEIEQHNDVDLEHLIALLKNHQLLPIALRCQTSEMKERAKKNYLAILPVENKQKKSQDEIATSYSHFKVAEIERNLNPALVIEQAVRSGQQIYAQGGDLIILAPVSPGAEILADGNIHVYGALRGRVYAGFSGDIKARIFCHLLAAEFISIAGRYLICEHLDYARVQDARQIYLENDQLKIASLFSASH